MRVQVTRPGAHVISPILNPYVICKEWDDWIAENFPNAYYEKQNMGWLLESAQGRSLRVDYYFLDNEVGSAFKLRWC